MDRCALSDEEIVRKVLEGEVNFFAELVKRYQRKIVHIGMMFYRNEDDAWDFAQEVFIKLYENLSSFKGKSKLHFWIYRIAYNYGINSTKGTVQPQSLVEYAWEGLLPDKWYEQEEIRTALLKAVQSLPENYRICVDLYFFYDMTYGEIAKITGFPVNTIKSNVFRAKQFLRNALKEFKNGELQ